MTRCSVRLDYLFCDRIVACLLHHATFSFWIFENISNCAFPIVCYSNTYALCKLLNCRLYVLDVYIYCTLIRNGANVYICTMHTCSTCFNISLVSELGTSAYLHFNICRFFSAQVLIHRWSTKRKTNTALHDAHGHQLANMTEFLVLNIDQVYSS